jgi:RNA-directed DNA polymerase
VTQPDAREGQAGPPEVAERSVVLKKPGNAGGGKGPQFQVNVRGGQSQEIGVSLVPPQKVRKLQATLHAKAKRAPNYRFYALYDKLYRDDVLGHAYRCCKANGGAAGVDGQTFADIEAYGLSRWLGELAEELRNKTYRPEAVRRVYIPKPDGKQRPLGIPTVKDRVVQTAALVVLEPIFEADLQPEQYAYRPGRSALDAIQQVQELLDSGHREIVDTDLSGYFDSLPHGALMRSVARRVSDRHLLALIKCWLEAPVEEVDERGRKRRTTRNQDERRGCPQGAPLSPLLANLYMRRFVLGWKVLGHERRLDAHIVNYADDFVICCRGTAAEAMTAMRQIMRQLQLTVQEAKTQICRVSEDTFEFLGYTFGRNYSPRSGRSYLGPRPAAASVQEICAAISEQTRPTWGWLDPGELVRRLNQQLRGWANYFCLGNVSRAYQRVMAHTCFRLRQWLGRKYHVQGTSRARYSYRYLREKLGLVWLPALARPRSLWANA